MSLALAFKLGTGDRLAIADPASGGTGTPAPVLVGALFNVALTAPTPAFHVTHSIDARTHARRDVAPGCLTVLSLPARFVAPVAARCSAHTPVVPLRRLFALCLAAVATRLLLRA